MQWLFLHKKLNHWSSTRGTAEVLYALAHYLKQEGQLGVREEATVRVGAARRSRSSSSPTAYTGKAQPGRGARRRAWTPRATSAVVVEKTTPGMMFASATWHYSTDRLPDGGARRPLRGLAPVLPAREPARDVDPDAARRGRGAGARATRWRCSSRSARSTRPSTCTCATRAARGFEPVTLGLRLQVGPGLGLYEEVRDSGDELLLRVAPRRRVHLQYRIRAATAGRFRVGPAEVQSMYAPEFAARSAGAVLQVGGGGR